MRAAPPPARPSASSSVSWAISAAIAASTASARSGMVGRWKTVWSGRSTSNVSQTRRITSIAPSDVPPSSKKVADVSTRSTRSTSRQIAAMRSCAAPSWRGARLFGHGSVRSTAAAAQRNRPCRSRSAASPPGVRNAAARAATAVARPDAHAAPTPRPHATPRSTPPASPDRMLGTLLVVTDLRQDLADARGVDLVAQLLERLVARLVSEPDVPAVGQRVVVIAAFRADGRRSRRR